TMTGVPGKLAPTRLIRPRSAVSIARWAKYQMEGADSRRCGSLARRGLPVVVRVPATTQLFDAPASRISSSAAVVVDCAVRSDLSGENEAMLGIGGGCSPPLSGMTSSISAGDRP